MAWGSQGSAPQMSLRQRPLGPPRTSGRASPFSRWQPGERTLRVTCRPSLPRTGVHLPSPGGWREQTPDPGDSDTSCLDLLAPGRPGTHKILGKGSALRWELPQAGCQAPLRKGARLPRLSAGRSLQPPGWGRTPTEYYSTMKTKALILTITVSAQERICSSY